MLWKTGHSLIKAKMKETHAALAGEMSGHTFFGERWYGFDDGMYAGARLLEILSREQRPVGPAEEPSRRGVHARAQHRSARKASRTRSSRASPRRRRFPARAR